MSGNTVITSVKSYIEYSLDGEKRQKYAVSSIEDGEVEFVFLLPAEIEMCRWCFFSDFRYKISDLKVVVNEHEKQLDCYCSDDGKTILSDIHSENREFCVKCRIRRLSLSEENALLRQNYSNKLAHIEQLILSERNLLRFKQGYSPIVFYIRCIINKITGGNK